MTPKKERELRLIQHLRTISGTFPDGPLTPDEEPDVILMPEGRRLGIEITQIYEVPAKGQRPRREIEDFHVKVVSRAEEIYKKSGARPVDVLMYFGDVPLRGVEDTAEQLVEYVRSHPPAGGCETFNEGLHAPFSVVRVLEVADAEGARWRCYEGGRVPVLTQSLLAEVIAEKNRRLSAYRRKADEVWLLIASPIAPFSSSFAIPLGFEDWRFTFDFERVLLYAWERGVIDLPRV